MQISYAQTEGYLPVTTKAHNSNEYKNYLSRSGEDNDLYYDIKLDATKLVLNNIDNTFVTPVFNGSASLRNAAGQLIEEVTKAARRNQTVNGEFIDKKYAEMTSLYKLNEITVSSGDEQTSESDSVPKIETPLPTASIVLLSSIGAIWILIGSYYVYRMVKTRKISRKT